MEQALPPLTDYQKEVLVGSLLGDGHMNAPGSKTGRYSEGHCLDQEPYLLWKAEVFGPYVSTTFNVEKKDKTTGKVYFARWLVTHSSTHLRPMYDLFYRAGQRVFPASLPDLFTPLVLAVWYMDDGSAGGYNPQIAFGLDDTSLKRAVKALRKLGLNPEVHGEGSQSAFYFPGQADTFFNLVRPHVHPCLAYKVPDLSDRQKADRNAKKLTAETAVLLTAGGMLPGQVGKLFGVGVSTVRRRVHEAGDSPKRMGRPRYKYSRVAADVALAKYDPRKWDSLSDSEKTCWVDEVFTILRGISFPFPEVAGAVEALEGFDKLVQVRTSLEGKEIRPRSHAGLPLCGGYFPNRYRASWRGTRTAFEDWHLDAPLRWAIRFQLDSGGPVLPHRVLRVITMQRRTPTIFRPVVAKYVYQTYCPSGGLVWDPCSGFGGRLLGALAAGVRYVGTDVEPDTVDGNNRLAKVLGKEDRARVVLHPAETFQPPEGTDLVFTSPPYFSTEIYGVSDEQSAQQYPSFDRWLEGFLRPLVQTAYRVLPTGGHLVLNVNDIRHRGRVFPLVARTGTTATEAGFTLVDTLVMPLARLNKAHAWEPVLVFRK